VLALPGHDVPFLVGRISVAQVASQRQSYINGLLIQSRGAVRGRRCTNCERGGLSPFPSCRRLFGHFGNACGNCKWRDHAIRCTDPDDSDLEGYEVSEPDSDDPAPAPAPPPKRLRGAPSLSVEEVPPSPPAEVASTALVRFHPGAGTKGDPIDVDSDGGAYRIAFPLFDYNFLALSTYMVSCCSCTQRPSGYPCNGFTFSWCMG
jgi:hypothetical protein